MEENEQATDWAEVMSAGYEVKPSKVEPEPETAEGTAAPAGDAAEEAPAPPEATAEGQAERGASEEKQGASEEKQGASEENGSDDGTPTTEAAEAGAVAPEPPSPACSRRSCRLAARGMRTHVALAALAVVAAVACGAYQAIPFMGLEFETPLVTAANYAASYAPLLPALAVALGLPAVALAIAAGGTAEPVTRAGTLVAWVIDSVVAVGCLAALALSAMGSSVPTMAGIGVATVVMTYLAVNDELAARAALKEMGGR